MFNWLKSIADTIFTVFQLLLNIINGIVQFFIMVPKFVAYVITAVAYIPAPLVIFITVGTSISVVLLIVGRN
jgi:hypothetical protein